MALFRAVACGARSRPRLAGRNGKGGNKFSLPLPTSAIERSLLVELRIFAACKKLLFLYGLYDGRASTHRAPISHDIWRIDLMQKMSFTDPA
jgi:hypothetical protein